jgi:hypothetical protein
LDATIGTLRAAGLPVIIIGRAPSFRDTVPNILAKRVLRGDSRTIGGNDGVGTAFWSDHFLKDRYGGLAGVRYISFEDTICRESECPLVTASGVPAFWDHSHLTREGADWAVGRMFPAGLGIRAAQ